jgi:chromosome partitioning protein
VGQTIACANQKGGVGKTTTVVNLGTYLAMAGQRVLVVDVDPQGNATSGLGIDRSLAAMTLYDSLVEGAGIEPSIVATAIAGLSVVPSSVELAGADVELAAVDQRERRLRRVLETVRNDYDYILLDCPPSLGLLTVNALTAADAVLIPLQSEYYALEGLTQLIATVNLVRDHLNPQLEIAGVVLTMYDARTNLSADVAGEARRHLGAAVFETVIPRNVRLSEAPSFGMPIALYRPDSRGAESYAALTDEFLRRGRDSGVRSGSVASVAAATLRHESAAAGMRS